MRRTEKIFRSWIARNSKPDKNYWESLNIILEPLYEEVVFKNKILNFK